MIEDVLNSMGVASGPGGAGGGSSYTSNGAGYASGAGGQGGGAHPWRDGAAAPAPQLIHVGVMLPENTPPLRYAVDIKWESALVSRAGPDGGIIRYRFNPPEAPNMTLQTRDRTEEKTWFTCHGYVESGGSRREVCYGAYGYEGTHWGGATPYRFDTLARAQSTLDTPPRVRNDGVAFETIQDKFIRRHYQKVETQTTYGCEIVEAQTAPALGGTPGTPDWNR